MLNNWRVRDGYRTSITKVVLLKAYIDVYLDQPDLFPLNWTITNVYADGTSCKTVRTRDMIQLVEEWIIELRILFLDTLVP